MAKSVADNGGIYFVPAFSGLYAPYWKSDACGAAYAAGLAVGFWKDYDELRANWGMEKEWHSSMDSDVRKKLYSGWKKAVTRTFDWIE